MKEIIEKPNKRKSHYVNNADFLKALVQWKKDCSIAKKENKPVPKIPDYIGKCLILIANNLSHKPNFNSYTFKDEMIGDAIENCILYFNNFDPKKSKNPFAYFTQIIYYAFIRRIHKEKKQLYAKYKATEQLGVLDEHEQLDNSDDNNKQFELYENISEFIGNYEMNEKKKKKEKKTSRRLELFMEDAVIDIEIPEESIKS